MTLREQAEQRKRLERFRTIQAVLGYFESRNAHITPNELYEEYLARAHKYHRPAQAKVLQIVMRPSDKAERKEVRAQKLALFKNLQNAADPALRAIVEARLDRYLAGSTEEQDRLLDETIAAVAAMAARTDLMAADLQMVEGAGKILKRQEAFRDQDATMKQLAEIRARLAGRDATAFMDLAKTVSQGPKASDGGDLGWIEPGTYSPGFDAVAFSLAAGTLSEVFWSEDTANLLFVTERKEARTLPFAEVSAEIETELSDAQHEETRKRMVAMLRAKASIVNAIPIDQVVE
jgi:parvulin-like peptidyl-prolyl isomerase